jgi:hypothetical protein
MDDQIDIAVYIALNEEFTYVRDTLPAPSLIEEDPDISVTYYLFRLRNILGTRVWNDLLPLNALVFG